VSLDAYYLFCSIEDHFGVRIEEADITRLLDVSDKRNNMPPDMTVGTLLELILNKLEHAGGGMPWVDHAACDQCGYRLRGLKAMGRCPECGTTYDLRDAWQVLCRLIEDQTGMIRGKIKRTTCLGKDLGFL